METVFSLEQIKYSVRRLRPIAQKDVRIDCDLTEAIPYHDLLDTYLSIRGVKNWHWIDKEGKEIRRQSLWLALSYLVRDFLAWPSIIMRERMICRSLAGQPPLRLIADRQNSSVLYLRTDHWFNLKSGGSVGHVRGVVDSLRRLGWRTVVASTDLLNGIARDGDFCLVRPRYGLGRNLPEIPQYLYNTQLIKTITAYWETWRPAWIYQRYSLGNYSGAALKKKYHVPLVMEYNGSFRWIMDHWGEKPLFHKNLADAVEMTNLRAGDVIVVVSKAARDELIARGIDEAKILVNPNGVDIQRYTPDIDGSEVRKEYHLEDFIVVGFIGTFGAWHGAEILAQAVGQFAKKFPAYEKRVRFLLIGDGQSMPAVKRIIAAEEAQAWVALTGAIPQEQGAPHLAACDILVAPQIPNPDGSPFFGSPTKVFEYMAMGKGIVASGLDQIGEVLVHGQSAWLVEPGDVGELMHGIKMLVDDEGLRRRLGEAARIQVAQKYTWLAHTQRTLDFLSARN